MKAIFANAFATISAIALAFSLTACGGGQPASPSVAGAYGVDVKQISTEGIDGASTIIVVAPCQGQAFQVPLPALATARAGIEAEQYCGYVTADSRTVNGRSYVLTKNSEGGREDEAYAYLLDYVATVCNARATSEGVELLESMNAAASQLQAQGSGAKTMCVVSSGVTNGVLDMSEELLQMPAKEVVTQLERQGCIADYTGIEVHLYGLGQATGDQVIPASSAASIKTLYSSVVTAGGGKAIVESDQLKPLGCDEQLPRVDVVDFTPDTIEITEPAPGETASVTLDETAVTFVGDSDEFADPKSAKSTISQIASVLKGQKYEITIDGYTADTGSGDGMSLSTARAKAVASALVEAGVDRSSIVSVKGHGCEGSTSMASGSFNEAQAKKDRKVMISFKRMK